MNSNRAFVCLGVVFVCLFLSPAPSFAASSADAFSAEELHSLYKSGRLYDCYRASAMAAKSHPRAAAPYFYAALALSKSETDQRMKEVRNPYGKALHFLEVAKSNDPSGRQLQGLRKGLALVQNELIEKAAKAYREGNVEMEAYFERMAKVFNQREGTWKNFFHHGRFLVRENYDFSQWDNPFYRLADTGKDLPGISQEVRQIIYLHNLCRMNPKLFRDTYLKQFNGGNLNTRQDIYMSTLIDDLGKTKPMPPLYPDKELLYAADYHAKDLAANRIFRHESSDGTSFSDRMRKLAGNRGFCGENCAAGYNDALDAFMGLLIDRGVPSYGHRYNILNSGYKKIGIGVNDPEDQWKIWVFDFAGR